MMSTAGLSSRQQPARQLPHTETSYLYIPNTAVGAIIGTKGSHIRNIIKFSGSTVKIASQDEEEDLSKLGGVSSIPGGGTTQGAPVSSEGVSTTQGEASSPGVATKPQGGPTLGSAPVSPVTAQAAPPGQEFSSPP